MKSRIYWGVALLIILLIGVSVFMLMRNTDTEPKVVYRVPSTEVVQQAQKANALKRPAHSHRVIEEYPYSEAALQARYSLFAPSVYNEKLLSICKEMLRYHLDSSRLLFDLTSLAEDEFPKELIAYRKETLKNVDLYPSDSLYSRWKSRTTKAIQNFCVFSYEPIFLGELLIVPDLPDIPPFIDPLPLFEFSLD